MQIIKIDEAYATDVKKIIRAAYLPLLEKYHDEKENPANKTVDDVIYDLQMNTYYDRQMIENFPGEYVLRRYMTYI